MNTLAETIQTHIELLPPALQQETLDFIEFLEQRYGITRIASKSSNATEAFITRHAGALSDDSPDDIEDHDEEIHAKDRELSRREALARLAKIHINFGGKPMTDREEANARR